MKKLLNLSCFVMLFIFQANAKNIQSEPSFSVEVSKTEVLLGNYIEVSFTLKNANANQFEAPQFEGFDIVGGPNQSSSFSMMNGVTTQSVSYTYYLKPKEVGNLFVPPAYIKADGETLETQPIEIFVLENPDGIIEQPQRNRMNRMEMFQFPNDDFFNFPSDDFFQFPDPNELFNMPRKTIPQPKQEGKEGEEAKPKKPKKKRKTYRI